MLIGIDASRATTTQRTGTEAYAYHLITHLIQLTADSGHTLRLYTNTPPPAGLFSDLPHIDHRPIPFPRLWTHLRLATELHQRPPDVFFTPAHVIPVSYFGRSVVTIHDLGYHYFPDAHTPAQLRQLKWSTRHNARRAHTILADSQATKTDLTTLYNIPPSKIHIIYPGIPNPKSKIQNPKSNPPYLLFLSTLHPRKNLSRLITAFAQIADQIPHDLVLAGKLGWRAESILDTINQLPVEIRARIKRPGFIPDEEKYPLIAGADLFLYPSLYEGFGFPLLEANACGTAVLTSNTSSLPELAGNNAALQVNPLDTAAIAQGILRILQDDNFRRQLITNGRENVKRFNWHTAAQQTLDLLLQAAQT